MAFINLQLNQDSPKTGKVLSNTEVDGTKSIGFFLISFALLLREKLSPDVATPAVLNAND